jgi:hypothetical protein
VMNQTEDSHKAITWMIGWALLGYIFAPYEMWKHHRTRSRA